jgi:hypothetical protein
MNEQQRATEQIALVQEPLVWFIQYSDSHEFRWREPEAGEINGALEISPLYAAPPAQPAAWVGLTGHETVELWDYVEGELSGGVDRFARAIEAKLREKNGGKS